MFFTFVPAYILSYIEFPFIGRDNSNLLEEPLEETENEEAENDDTDPIVCFEPLFRRTF